MLCENNSFTTLIVDVHVARNCLWTISKRWTLELGVGLETYYNLNINVQVHKDLNLILNDQVYSRNYNAPLKKHASDVLGVA